MIFNKMPKIRYRQRTVSVSIPPKWKPKDIMLGNYLKDKTGKYIQVDPQNYPSIIEHPESYIPILITHDLLISSLFEKEGDFKYYLDIIEGIYFMFTGTIGLIYKQNYGSIGRPIRYVHELQNTCYFLTGAEPSLKLLVVD